MKISYSDEKLRVVVDDELCIARWLDTPDPKHFDEVLRGAQHMSEGLQPITNATTERSRWLLPHLAERPSVARIEAAYAALR